jgi:predicted dehydrogenase
LKAIIFGFGRMGQRFLEICKNNHVTVVGVFDIDASSLTAAASNLRLNNKIVFTDAQKMCDEADADIAIIATTAPSHFALASMAIGKGIKYILCEKPVVTNLREYDHLVEMVKTEQVNFAVNHQMRHMNEYKTVKSYLNRENLGNLVSMTVMGGNAGIAMNGTHILELFHFLTGEKLVRVHGWFDCEEQPNPRGREYLDPGGVLKAFTESRKVLTIDFPTNCGFGYTMIINAEQGQIIADLLSGNMIINCRKTGDKAKPTGLYSLEPDVEKLVFQPTDAITSSSIVLQELIKGPLGDFCSLEEAGWLIRIVLAAYSSDSSGHVPIEIGSDFSESTLCHNWA